jgi:hypothetical protein
MDQIAPRGGTPDDKCLTSCAVGVCLTTLTRGVCCCSLLPVRALCTVGLVMGMVFGVLTRLFLRYMRYGGFVDTRVLCCAQESELQCVARFEACCVLMILSAVQNAQSREPHPAIQCMA